MDYDKSFELEGHDSSFSVTHTHSTPLKKQHECGICGISVDTKLNLRKHLQEHSSADVQEEALDLSLSSENVAISPIRHSDSTDMDTDDFDLDLSCTVDVATEEPKFSCEICDFSSKFKHNVKRHLKVHTELKNAPKFKSHSKDENKKYREALRCDVCTYTTLYKFNLTRHVSKVHSGRQNDQRPVYICEFCGKELHSRFSHRLHVKTVHAKIFKYACHTCSKGYNQLKPYKGHLASHLDILKEKCDLCPASFNYKKSLAEHKQAVHENLTFNCTHPSCSAV